MVTNNAAGRALAVAMGIYIAIKAVLNMILGGGFNFGDVLFAVVAFVALYSGMQYLNYAVSAFMALIILTHLKYNITNLPDTIVYLLEAFSDVLAIGLLVFHKSVKEHFTNKWSELSTLFK